MLRENKALDNSDSARMSRTKLVCQTPGLLKSIRNQVLTVSRANTISLFTRQFGTQPQLVPNQALYQAERERENKFIA